jgi:uncharacterized protein (DUF58 family)
MTALPFYRSFYLTPLVYYAGFTVAGLFVLSFFSPVFSTIAYALLLFTAIAVLIDSVLLYSRNAMTAERLLPDRFSNGDSNKIGIQLSNRYNFAVQCTVIDELPFQFQERTWQRIVDIGAVGAYLLTYTLTPLTRGAYAFGYINVYVRSPLRMVQRRYRSGQQATVPVYPSYVQMRQHQLSAIGNSLQQAGTKRIRRLGHSTEFEQIKEYVPGDDYRTVNWKATARHGGLMVNTYTDERSQQVYCIINKGRAMKMPFDGMTLLDFAINGTLALLNVALRKGDKGGLITYAQQVDTFLPADKKMAQLNHLMEALYNEQTHFAEPDNEALFSAIRNRLHNAAC